MNDIISVYRASAAAMRARVGFDGTMLLFKKGDWTAGKDNVDMNGVELVALPSELMHGWCKWEDKKPVDYRVGFIRDGYKPPSRGELGDNDTSKWERRGSDRVDPWQFTRFLPLVDPESGQIYVYSTTSKGGRFALADLQDAYADHLEKGAEGAAPRVALMSETGHGEYGEFEKPVLKIVDFVDPPPGLKPIRPPSPAAVALEYGATPLIEHKPLSKIVDDDIPF